MTQQVRGCVRALGLALALAAPLRADFIAYEGFDYATVPVLTNLNGLAGGLAYPSYGWSTAWWHNYQSTDAPSAIGTGSLTWPGMEDHGNRLSLFREATRTLSRTVGGTHGTVWCGLLFHHTNSKRTAYFRLYSGGTKVLEIASRPTYAVTLSGASSGVTAKSSKQFFLLRLDFQPAGNVAYLWVDPSLSAEPAPGTAQATQTYGSNWSFNSVALVNDTAVSQVAHFDELRIGTRFQDAIQGTLQPPVGTVVLLR